MELITEWRVGFRKISSKRALPPSRVRKQVIGPRISRSWLEQLDDES